MSQKEIEVKDIYFDLDEVKTKKGLSLIRGFCNQCDYNYIISVLRLMIIGV